MPEKITGESFKPKALKSAEEYFKNVHMTQEQHVLDFLYNFSCII